MEAPALAKCRGGCTREEGLRAWRSFLDILEKAEISRQLKEEQLANEKRIKATGKTVSPTEKVDTGKPVGTSGGKSINVKIAVDGE